VHVFLWAFLPWVAVFVAAVWSGLRSYAADTARGRAQFVFLCGTFFVTFGLFSATSFQLDYYTVILFPFANILCAHFLAMFLQRTEGKLSSGKVFLASHVFVTLCTLVLANALAVYVANTVLLVLVGGGTLGLLAYALARRANLRVNATLFYPLVAVNLLYVFLEGMTLVAYLKYSVPHNVKPMLAAEPQTPVVVYQLDPIVAWELGLYRTSAPSERLDDAARLPPPGQSYFLLLKTAQVPELAPRLGSFKVVGQGDWVDHKTGTLPRQLNLAKGTEPLEKFSLLKVGLN
jgi:hypothetical protein